LQLARKYALVRLTSLLRSMVVHPGVIDLARAERECRMLASIRDDSKDDFCAQVADLAQYLSGLAPDDRRERLEILRRLDEMSADGVVVTTTVNLASGTTTTTRTGSSLRARCHSQYFDAVRAPIERLRLASRTGSLKTPAEEARDRETRNRDIGLMRSPLVSDSERSVYEADAWEKSDPAAYVTLIEAHCELLLKLGEQMKHVEQLQLGAWIDRLTIMLVRLKKWREAKKRLDAYFALPAEYHGRSSPSELESMKRRLEHCKLHAD
jgi:hypothetical protein